MQQRVRLRSARSLCFLLVMIMSSSSVADAAGRTPGVRARVARAWQNTRNYVSVVGHGLGGMFAFGGAGGLFGLFGGCVASVEREVLRSTRDVPDPLVLLAPAVVLGTFGFALLGGSRYRELRQANRSYNDTLAQEYAALSGGADARTSLARVGSALQDFAGRGFKPTVAQQELAARYRGLLLQRVGNGPLGADQAQGLFDGEARALAADEARLTQQLDASRTRATRARELAAALKALSAK